MRKPVHPTVVQNYAFFRLRRVALLLCSFGFCFAFAQVFPVTLEHKYGSTTISAPPKRVISVGWNDQDALFSLGVKPLAIGYWSTAPEGGIWPWAEAAADGAAPVVLRLDELNLEAILALEPDLIIGQYSGMTREDYDRLSQIAPTVAQSGDYPDYATPWQEMTKRLGRAFGKEAEAEALVAGVEKDFSRAAAAHPEFAGKSVAVVLYGDAQNHYIYRSGDIRAQVFTALGFEVPGEIDELAGENFYFTVSQERFDLLDRDVLVFMNIGDDTNESLRQRIMSDPLLGQLEVVKKERAVYLADDSADALDFGTVLSLPYALEQILPELSAVVAKLE